MTKTMNHTEIFRRHPGNLLVPSVTRKASLSLTQVVEAAAQAVEDESIDGPGRRSGRDGADARRLLSALAWSYARDIFSSATVARWVGTDVAARWWNGGPPSRAEIIRFRNDNRAAVQACVLAALRHRAAQKLSDGVVTRVNESFLSAEANRRVVMAMFVDSGEGPACLEEAQATLS